jgi:hypothetical protein
VRRDAELRRHIRRVWEENFRVYGVRKIWRQLGCEGVAVARCPPHRMSGARLRREMGLEGAVRSRLERTTVSDEATPCPRDHVNREFRAERANLLPRASC